MSTKDDSAMSPHLDHLFRDRENLSQWRESLESAVLTFCADHGPDGALGLACDAASWLSRHTGAVVARPVYPDPGLLPDPATPAQRQAHAKALLRFKDFSTAAVKLRQLALGSIGETNTDACRDANLRLHHATAKFIITLMNGFHGTYTEGDINDFLEALKTKLKKSASGFDDHAAKFHKTIAKLNLARAPVGPFAACRTFVETLSGFPAYEKHVDNYVTAAPVPNTRTVAALVVSLCVHLATIASKSKASPFTGAMVLDPVLIDASKLTRPQLVAALAALPKDGNRDRGRNRDRDRDRSPPVTSDTTPDGVCYCYRHGHNASHGWSKQGTCKHACNYMKDRPEFTDAMKDAKHPSAVAGGCRNVQQKRKVSVDLHSPSPSPLTPPLPPPPHSKKPEHENPHTRMIDPPPLAPPTCPRDDMDKPMTSPSPFVPPANSPACDKPPLQLPLRQGKHCTAQMARKLHGRQQLLASTLPSL
jgi:hypothetical protein